MTYTNILKASKFIAVHFHIAFTMEILIVQIFILDFVALERSQSFLLSFAIIYEDLYYSTYFKNSNKQSYIQKKVPQCFLDLLSNTKKTLEATRGISFP